MWNLFACIALPILLSLILINGRARTVVAFLISGMFMCMFAGAINGMIRNAMGSDQLFKITTVYTPIVEEVCKAFMVFLFVFSVSDRIEDIVPVSMAVGIGFAVMENVYILASELGSWGPLSALTRAFGASLMHGVCTSMVGIGMSFIYKKRKLFYTGTLALLMVAMTCHGIFNALVQSAYSRIGILLPIVIFIAIGTMVQLRYRRDRMAIETGEKKEAVLPE